MKYLNEESQFTRVSNEHARMMMESMGYTVPATEVELAIEEVPLDMAHTDQNVYRHESELYALTEEVVDGSDNQIYVRVVPLDESFILKVDESGREQLTEAVTYEDSDYNLEGLFNDEEGDFFVCMEAVEVEEEEEEEEEESPKKLFGKSKKGKKGKDDKKDDKKNPFAKFAKGDK
tara:strand:- start:304 stop:831 length:528 start_codon:yes stop_codon:yes gene_type:complete